MGRTLGCGSWRSFSRIALPLARPGNGSPIVSGGRIFLTMPGDEGGKKRRQELDEQERLEREERARQHANKLKHDADEVKRSEDS